MKYRLKVAGRTFEVEIQDLNAAPVVAIVDGEPIEVWVEDSASPHLAPETSTRVPKSEPAQVPASLEPALSSKNGKEAANSVKAPIPGIIVSVAVQPGDPVQSGQELCVLEAMKMKNTIRANRTGTIASVSVSPGQSVKHKQVLVEFGE